MGLMKKAALVLGLVAGLAACSGETPEVTLTPQQEQDVAARLAPEGKVLLESEVSSAAPAAAASGEPRSGEEIYNKYCFTCHATGVSNAPKLGDVAAWGPRLEQGIETLYTHAIQGLNVMPPKGLCMDCSDEELHDTVDYMVATVE